MHGVNPVMLERMRKRAEAERAPIADDTATPSEPAASEPAATAPIDDAAREAATHPENNLPEPTQAQKEAGNYAKGHVRLGGMDLSIENPAGSQRKGVDANGKAWSTTMQSHYGYIKGTVGRDKDHIDVFVKPGTAELADDAKVFLSLTRRTPTMADLTNTK
ncbi:hypothetical protein IB61_11490 [Brucella abortus LMN2]|nr:hypothetical protein IB61_11490 [Brucella abortus LMN2]